ncbi:L-serine ammonia-lyase, iron-sulfur-dependent subunit beta [Marinoscillum pacificum]|uniref:L-serine ammonia-lyase, iron-sulfur-dependent subunit beta n=1 Tax=Marinoscillum pacificum TaxID=392723 RepID=UPI002157ACA3|nr:L-serine ammonia-lyase, iron-sulfur-dependent subunit beta [Marinoscillum pacificum]
MSERSSVFDMIGPVMIGPSSSHTAGVVRIGRVARKILKSTPKKAIITFYNSFARTYEGHGSNRAILGGLLDFHTDDERIKDALILAEQAGLEYHFKSVGNASTLHPNTVKIEMTADDGTEATVVGESRGGGVIRMRSVNGFDTNFTASSHTLIVYANDQMGSIAFISDVLSHDDCNIATMTVSRKGKNDLACLVFEMDSGIKQITLAYISELNWVRNVLYIPDIDQ